MSSSASPPVVFHEVLSSDNSSTTSVNNLEQLKVVEPMLKQLHFQLFQSPGGGQKSLDELYQQVLWRVSYSLSFRFRLLLKVIVVLNSVFFRGLTLR